MTVLIINKSVIKNVPHNLNVLLFTIIYTAEIAILENSKTYVILIPDNLTPHFIELSSLTKWLFRPFYKRLPFRIILLYFSE